MARTTKRKLPRSLLVLVTTCCSLLIAGCAGSGPTIARANPCTPGVCFGVVTVQSCTISVDPPTIHVDRSKNIEWTFSDLTPGYSFPVNGIVIPPPSSGFTHRPGSGKKFILHDDHSQLGLFKYTVYVVKDSDGTPCPPLDPMISND